MRRFLILFCVGVLLIGVLAILFPISALSDAKAIENGVIRLHVLANSDSEEDQMLKLTVRDRVLSYMESFTESHTDDQTSECSDLSAVKNEMIRMLPEIADVSRDVLRNQGCEDEVQVTLTEEYYPTRTYEDLRFPAGRYHSLRIQIGKGEGHNWWCVLFPPICLSSARADEELAEVGFTPNQIRLLTEDEDVHVRVRFKIVEVAASLKERFRTLFRS